MADTDLLLYTAKICPYAHRVELTLAETGQAFQRYEIDLFNKPEWYESKVNKASKVPVLVIPKARKGQDVYLPESLVVAEYIAERFAKEGAEPLLPDDPLEKARIRYLIERFSQLYSPHWGALSRERDASAAPKVLNALKEFQDFLPAEEEGPYFLGQRFSFAEVAIAPFIGRLLVFSQEGFLPKTDVDIATTILNDTSFKRLATWWNAVSSRPSWAKSFDEAAVVEQAKRRVAKFEKDFAEKNAKV